MKNKSKIYVTFIIVILVFALTAWNIYRFIPHSPMADLEYKQAILKDSMNITYTIEALRPIMGPNELSEFIKANDKNPEIYTPSKKNITNGIFRANLHTHTTDSDGLPTVEERMDSAQQYANDKIRDGYMLIAITDHDTLQGAENVIKTLQNNRGKYSKIRVIPGVEIYTEYNSKIADKPVPIHVLTWCINPFNRSLKKELYNPDNPVSNFDWIIQTMSKYGIAGIAHPARYTSFMKDKKYPYIAEMLTRYKSLTTNTPFTEGYYQSYGLTKTAELLGNEYDKYINYINTQAENSGINRTGSNDSHGYSIFSYK